MPRRRLRAVRRWRLRVPTIPDDAARTQLRRRASLAIAAGAVGVSCSTLGAAWEASAANGEWQESVRAQNRVSGRTIEITRYLYEVEAPQAFDLAALTVQADELEHQAATAPPGSVVRQQAAVHRRAADALARTLARTNGAAAANGLAADPAYRTAAGGFDVRRRLRDLQQREWDPRDDPGPVTEAGDATARRARAWTHVMELSLLPSLAGMAVWYATLRPAADPAFPWRSSIHRLRRVPRGILAQLRTPTRQAGPPTGQEPEEAPDVGLGAPTPPAVVAADDAAPGQVHRFLAGIGLALGILATVFTAVQIRAGLQENQAFAAAARHAAHVTATASGGGVRQAFGGGGRWEIALLETRREAQAAQPGSTATRLAAADAAIVARLDGILTTMAAPPRSSDGIAAPLLAVASATLADAVAATDEQHAGVAAADRAGTRSNRMVISLFAVTVAAILLDVAAAARPGRRRPYLAAALTCAGIALTVALTGPYR